MGQAVPEGKENNNTCPRVYTRRHISSYIKNNNVSKCAGPYEWALSVSHSIRGRASTLPHVGQFSISSG